MQYFDAARLIMKCKINYNKILIVTVLCSLILSIAMVSAYAEPVSDQNPTEIVETQPQTEQPTEPETEPETTPVTEPVTEPKTEPATAAPQQTDAPTQEQPTQNAGGNVEQSTKDDSILPTVDSSEIVIPTAVGTLAENAVTNATAGIVSWLCVGIGIAVIIGVLLSTKTNERKNGGKQRYGSGNKITGKKRLLSDEYYQNRKKNN